MGSIGRHRKNNRSRDMKNGSRANVSHFRMGANGIRDSIINLSSTDFGQNFRPAEEGIGITLRRFFASKCGAMKLACL